MTQNENILFFMIIRINLLMKLLMKKVNNNKKLLKIDMDFLMSKNNRKKR